MPTFAVYAKQPAPRLGEVFVEVGRALGLEPTEQPVSAAASVSIEAGKADAVAIVGGEGPLRTLVEGVARTLAGRGASVQLVSVHVPRGGRGRGTTADGAHYAGATVTADDDVQGAADELVTDWLQGGSGGGFDEEELEEGLARDLLDVDDAKRRASSLSLAVVRSARTAPFLAAIARGEAIELVTVGGRRGAKLKMPDGSSRIALLDGSELSEIEAALAQARRSLL